MDEHLHPRPRSKDESKTIPGAALSNSRVALMFKSVPLDDFKHSSIGHVVPVASSHQRPLRVWKDERRRTAWLLFNVRTSAPTWATLCEQPLKKRNENNTHPERVSLQGLGSGGTTWLYSMQSTQKCSTDSREAGEEAGMSESLEFTSGEGLGQLSWGAQIKRRKQ